MLRPLRRLAPMGDQKLVRPALDDKRPGDLRVIHAISGFEGDACLVEPRRHLRPKQFRGYAFRHLNRSMTAHATKA
ncbi:MAG: hypothetical protein IT361_03955 [Gemmatimonadaceae bacterium]|nr:hypothetical protein [Gemmatimonadaceae bacterium]